MVKTCDKFDFRDRFEKLRRAGPLRSSLTRDQAGLTDEEARHAMGSFGNGSGCADRRMIPGTPRVSDVV